jgi:hypothetical protein
MVVPVPDELVFRFGADKFLCAVLSRRYTGFLAEIFDGRA